MCHMFFWASSCWNGVVIVIPIRRFFLPDTLDVSSFKFPHVFWNATIGILPRFTRWRAETNSLWRFQNVVGDMTCRFNVAIKCRFSSKKPYTQDTFKQHRIWFHYNRPHTSTKNPTRQLNQNKNDARMLISTGHPIRRAGWNIDVKVCLCWASWNIDLIFLIDLIFSLDLVLICYSLKVSPFKKLTAFLSHAEDWRYGRRNDIHYTQSKFWMNQHVNNRGRWTCLGYVWMSGLIWFDMIWIDML